MSVVKNKCGMRQLNLTKLFILRDLTKYIYDKCKDVIPHLEMRMDRVVVQDRIADYRNKYLLKDQKKELRKNFFIRKDQLIN